MHRIVADTQPHKSAAGAMTAILTVAISMAIGAVALAGAASESPARMLQTSTGSMPAG